MINFDGSFSELIKGMQFRFLVACICKFWNTNAVFDYGQSICGDDCKFLNMVEVFLCIQAAGVAISDTT